MEVTAMDWDFDEINYWAVLAAAVAAFIIGGWT